MSGSSSRFESIVDRQIRLAQERGEFDNLPGAGKPLPGRGAPDDELWWIRGYLRREGLPGSAMLPASLQLAKEIEQLPEAVRALPSEQAVREAVAQLNRRIAEHVRAPSGPPVPLRQIDAETADALVAQWQEGRAAASAEAPAPTARRRWFGRRR